MIFKKTGHWGVGWRVGVGERRVAIIWPICIYFKAEKQLYSQELLMFNISFLHIWLQVNNFSSLK